MNQPLCWLSLFAAALAVVAGPAAAAGDEPLPPAAAEAVDFVRDIQPLLAERCQHCHGEEAQEGQLRLDARAIVLKGGKSGPLLVRGKSADSLLIRRVVGGGPATRMPLDDEPLSAREIGLLRAWIDQGAKWPDGVGSPATAVRPHWAYVAPRAAPPPALRNAPWPENVLDAFVLARLESEKIAPSPPAERERLIRRAALDLVGLPPQPDEVEAFLADRAPDAYERLLDRLLASPRYGERWATPWLDAARYADSNGYQRDGFRTIWPFRDWVIQALNADMPFDQFTIEQIAGDLLPSPTPAQRIATGFHRCTTVNVEAGTDEEENRVAQVIDRVNVTGTVWLGTTLECCQCHNHKYDPFTQRDYYQLFAFFNSTPKETYQRTKGSAALEFGGPEMPLPADPAQSTRRQEVEDRVKRLQAALDKRLDDPASGLEAWERTIAAGNSAGGAAAKPPENRQGEERGEIPANIRRILRLPPAKRNKNHLAQLRNYFITQDAEARALQTQLDAANKELEKLRPPATLVMSDLEQPRMTAILERGDFLSPGERVEPGVPRALPPLDPAAPNNRLGLARWLVSPANPLTARVQVNRAWAQFFGRGIVASEEDFGTQAEPPTHPALLDWLAVELSSHGWSLKRIHRRIAESATYRQASRFRSDLVQRDPNNLLLARGPRLRLSAEQIRDQTLAAAGLLSSKLGGPPVFPPQPDGIWRVTGLVDNNYYTSTGEDAWRRGVYTIWRRSAPYPSFVSFDAPDRSACTVKRPRSNTPLQALTLQNDPVYVEAARALADRVLAGGAAVSPAAGRDVPAAAPLDRELTAAFRLVLSRQPAPTELAALRGIYQQAYERYAADRQARQQLLGKRELPPGCSPADWAAWFEVAQVLLNLDETITKG